MNKAEMREKFLAIRNNEPEEKRRQLSGLIHERLFSLDEYKNAQTVFSYVSFGSEVDTGLILERCFKDGKNVAVPKTKKNGDMDFISIRNLEALQKNKFGILEPENGEIVLPDEKALILVPGLVFSEDCCRIGYGKGFYDKYLKDKKYLSAIGLAFSFQMVKNIDIEIHDIRLNKVLTEAILWKV